MMKRIACYLLAVLLCAFTSLPARADYTQTGDLMLVVNTYQAPMYDSYNPQTRQVLTYVPNNEVVLYIAAIDWGYCVGYGNHIGYIDEAFLAKTNDPYVNFILPSGGDTPNSSPTGTPHVIPDQTAYVPQFPYYPVRCSTNQTIATRSGPSTAYNEPGSYQIAEDITVYYQVERNDVYWGCIEFRYRNEYYRIYTGMKRLDAYGGVPLADSEPYVYATITTEHTPRYGPGYQYAAAPRSVPANSYVKAFYQENGWVMFEYQGDEEKVMRAWAPAGYWR